MSRKRKKFEKRDAGQTQAAPGPGDISMAVAAQGRTRNERIWMYLLLGSLFLMGLVLGYQKVNSPDLGFHMSSARWILEHGAIPDKDIFTYTVPDNTYIDLQWTFQLITYGLEKLFGPAGIMALTTVLTLSFGATLLWRLSRREGRISLSGVILLIVFFLGNLWEIRPHLFSWIYGSLILLVLEEYARGQRRWLFLLPVLMLLWVNAHSLYILGLVSIGTYVFSDIVRGFWIHRRLHFDKSLLFWSIAAVVACLFNPYHIRGLLFPIGQFFLIQGESGYKSVLTGTAEFVSPFRFQEYIKDGRFILIQPRLWWQVFTLLALAGIIGGRKKNNMAEWLLFTGFLFIFHSASKNFGYFVMACYPACAGGLDSAFARLSSLFSNPKSPETRNPKSNRFSCMAWILVCLLLAAGAGTNWLYELGWQQNNVGHSFDKEALPVDACAFVNEHNIQGRIINSWNDGGFIGWKTGHKVFINSEGNTIGLEFYDEYVRAREPEGFPAALVKWKPTVAVVRYRVTPYWLYHLHNVANDWRMVYADNHVAVFLHESVSTEVVALAPPEAGKDYPAWDLIQAGAAVKHAIEAGGPGWSQWLRGSGAYPLDEMHRSAFYLHTNQLDACIGSCISGLEKASFIVPELMLNMGHALNARKQYRLADQCYDAFLSVDDDPVMAQEINIQRYNRRR